MPILEISAMAMLSSRSALCLGPSGPTHVTCAQKAALVAERDAIRAEIEPVMSRVAEMQSKAAEALQNLTKAEISEMKSYANPSAALRAVLNAVMALHGRKEDWKTAMMALSDWTFLKQCREFDIAQLKPKQVAKAAKYADLDEFKSPSVSAVSPAARAFRDW